MKKLSLLLPFVSASITLSAAQLLIDFNDAGSNLSNTATTLLIPDPVTTNTFIDGDAITIGFTNFQLSSSTGNVGAYAPGTFDVAADDYFFVRAASGSGLGITATLTFSGLAGSFYDISIASSVKNAPSAGVNGTRLADFSIGGSFGTGNAGDDFSSYTDGNLAGTTISWSSIAPTAGVITISITTPSGDADNVTPGTQDYVTMLNGLQITVIPEPSSFGLMLMGVGISAVLLRRKKA